MNDENEVKKEIYKLHRKKNQKNQELNLYL